MEQILYARGLEENVSPEAFHLWATQYYKCFEDFRYDGFSPVPYFLVCRVIELAIKSKHLNLRARKQVKEDFGHNLKKAYEALDSSEQILELYEKKELEKASSIYARKGFEYFVPDDAMRGYSEFPDLDMLNIIAKKLLGYDG